MNLHIKHDIHKPSKNEKGFQKTKSKVLKTLLEDSRALDLERYFIKCREDRLLLFFWNR